MRIERKKGIKEKESQKEEKCFLDSFLLFCLKSVKVMRAQEKKKEFLSHRAKVKVNLKKNIRSEKS